MRREARLAVGLLALGVGCAKNDRCLEPTSAEAACAEAAAPTQAGSAQAGAPPPAGSALAGAAPAGSAPGGSARAGSALAAAGSTPAASRPVPIGYVRVYLTSVLATEEGAAVLLAAEPERDEGTVLPIFVGGTEALSIDLRHRRRKYARPLTHDLLDSAIASLGGKVVEARITRFEATTFIGALFVAHGSEVVEIDARPSDAIALALGSEAPIHIARVVLEQAGIDKRELLEGKGRKRGDPTML